MQNESKAWWRGTFPTWIVVGLVGMLVSLLMGDRTTALTKLENNTDRIIALEAAGHYHKEEMAELKRIHITLTDQLERLRDELRRRP